MKSPSRNSDLSAAEKTRLLQRIQSSPAYMKAYEDTKFLQRRELRPVRLQLELLKPEMILAAHKIKSTIVVFGSARIAHPEAARRELADAQARAKADSEDYDLAQAVNQARMKVEFSRYYAEARRFAAIISRAQQSDKRLEFVIVTGGGPGIMEAANRGAKEAGGKSIGLNIRLPFEQEANPWIADDPKLITFKYFFTRKLFLVKEASAVALFPG
ncbi:MAG TPA: 3-isopropylmalate dehydrogenase, partial [Elusimicrobia bacterium]|nr:3-isopropylmalate dehydrogenase [Elusimicrobiota bacterium]